MEVRYLAIYKLIGINHLPGEADTLEFVVLPEFKTTTKLTSNPEPYCFHVDRSSALAIQLGKGLFNPKKKGTLDERLRAEINDVRANRQAACRSGVFLIFEGTDDIVSPNFNSRRDTNNFAICFDAFSQEVIRSKFRPVLQGVISALSMALPDQTDPRTERIGVVNYLVESDSGKVIYNFSFSGNAPTISIASSLSEDEIEYARLLARAFPVDANLANIANLLVESLETRTDDLRAFISSWSALEIFIKTMFEFTYKKHWDKIMLHDDRKNLTNKFRLLASILDPFHAKVDEEVFKSLYKTRNKLFHEGAMVEYPVEEIQKMLRKYLDLHLSVQRAGKQNSRQT